MRKCGSNACLKKGLVLPTLTYQYQYQTPMVGHLVSNSNIPVSPTTSGSGSGVNLNYQVLEQMYTEAMLGGAPPPNYTWIVNPTYMGTITNLTSGENEGEGEGG